MKRQLQRHIPEGFEPRDILRNEIQLDFERSDVRQGKVNRQSEFLPRHDSAVGDRQTREVIVDELAVLRPDVLDTLFLQEVRL